MKIIVQILSCFLFPTLIFAQVASTESTLLMPEDKNQQWLLTLKVQEKPQQWKMITDRYFQSNVVPSVEAAHTYTPLLIINGLLLSITDSTSEDIKRKLISLLTENKITDIKVIEKQPANLYIEKPFTGFILVSVTDKKTNTTLKKMELDKL